MVSFPACDREYPDDFAAAWRRSVCEELLVGGVALRAQIRKLEFGKRGRVCGGASHVSGLRNGGADFEFPDWFAADGFRTVAGKKSMVE